LLFFGYLLQNGERLSPIPISVIYDLVPNLCHLGTAAYSNRQNFP
jgi:hypothetical protein